jgi:hypothetical protein
MHERKTCFKVILFGTIEPAINDDEFSNHQFETYGNRLAARLRHLIKQDNEKVKAVQITVITEDLLSI